MIRDGRRAQVFDGKPDGYCQGSHSEGTRCFLLFFYFVGGFLVAFWAVGYDRGTTTYTGLAIDFLVAFAVAFSYFLLFLTFDDRKVN